MPGNWATIEAIVEKGLCTGCGTCAAVCPNEAVRMRIDGQSGLYMPQVVGEACNRCGVCLDVCPGAASGYDDLRRVVFGSEPKDALLGNHLRCYLAHATDDGIRYRSASGGLVTSLLMYALETGVVDGALVTGMDTEDPLKPRPYVARSMDEIVQATSSKYCPVPAAAALREMLDTEGRYAVVGLPCHIHGVRKAEQADQRLGERVKVCLGIFCSHTVGFGGTHFVLSRLGIGSTEMAGLSYRGCGWPGGVTVELRDGGTRFVPNVPGSLWSTVFSGFFFTPHRCLLCHDVTNELADISFGDAWLPEVMAKGSAGESVVITRSEQGESLLGAAAAAGVVEVEALEARDVVRSQRLFLHFKKVNLKSRRRLLSLLGKDTGGSVGEFGGPADLTLAALALGNSRFSCSRLGRFILRRIPCSVLRVYVNQVQRLQSRLAGGGLGDLGWNK